MNRGSAVNVGEQIWLIETKYDYAGQKFSRCKVYNSRPGFEAGLRAVKGDIKRPWPGGPVGFKTYTIKDPKWQTVLFP